jgi:hypothetical protein
MESDRKHQLIQEVILAEINVITLEKYYTLRYNAI